MPVLDVKQEIADLVRLFTELSTGNLPSNYRQRLAGDIAELTGGGVGFVSLDYGGYRQFQKMEPYLSEAGVSYKYVATVLPAAEPQNGLRPIISIDIRLKRYPHQLILIDDVTDVGSTTAISGVDGLLNARREGRIEFDSLYFVPMVARSHIANVAGFSWVEPKGLKGYLEATNLPTSIDRYNILMQSRNPTEDEAVELASLKRARQAYLRFLRNNDLDLLSGKAINHEDDLELGEKLENIARRDILEIKMSKVGSHG